MNDAACPRCGGTRIYRETRRVQCRTGGMTMAGWCTCRAPGCWHKFDGITDSGHGVLPAGVVARPSPSCPVLMTEEEIG